MNSTKQTKTGNPYSASRLVARQLRAIKIAGEDADFLVKNVAEDFSHRIAATNREFANAADFFSFSDKMTTALGGLQNVRNIQRFELPGVSDAIRETSGISAIPMSREPEPGEVSKILPRSGLDLVVSAFGLHGSNNPRQLLLSIFDAMKSDGMLLMALPVRGTLMELTNSLTRAELELSGGAAMRVDPFIDMEQAGRLLQEAGFKLPVIDKETLTVRYSTMFDLIADLRAMGLTSALTSGQFRYPPRQLFKLADELYRADYSDDDGRIRATFCFAYLTAWTPHENQQKPLKPGSAKFSLAAHLRK